MTSKPKPRRPRDTRLCYTNGYDQVRIVGSPGHPWHTVCVTDAKDARRIAAWLLKWADWKEQSSG